MAEYKVIDRRGSDSDYKDDIDKHIGNQLAKKERKVDNSPQIYKEPKKHLTKMTVKLLPSPGRIIVLEDSFHYGGKIIIPDTTQRRPTTGKVIAIGPGVEWEALAIGVRLVYGLYSGTVINFKNNPAFRILQEGEILAVVQGDKEELEGVGV